MSTPRPEAGIGKAARTCDEGASQDRTRPMLRPLALMLALLAPAPALADQVYEGRDAQRLHCAALLIEVAGRLRAAGLLDTETMVRAEEVAVVILSQLPGRPEDRVRAMVQRAERLMRDRPLPDVMREFERTFPWCVKHAGPQP